MADVTHFQKLKPNQIAGTNPVNKIIDALNRNFGDGTGLVKQQGYTFPPRLGTIVGAGPNGEADLTGPTYWVRAARITNPYNGSNGSTNSPGLNTDPLYIVPVNTSKESPADTGEIIPVTNFAEFVGVGAVTNQSIGSHSLPTDGSCAVVIDYFQYDAGGVPRYGFSKSPGNQTFQVVALPAYNSSSSQVDAWAICNPVSSNGSVGSMNIACGLCVPHSVGDKINAETVPYQVFGLGYQLSNGSTGVAMNVSGNIPITMQEVGQIGTPIRVAVVNGSTGTCNVASGSYATQQYDIYNNESSSIKLASNVAVTKHRIWPGKVTAATYGDIKLNESGNWVLLAVEEYAPSVNTC